MAGVKFMLMYPRPQDIHTFEHLYQDEDVPIGDGLSSEYAGTFEAFEQLYREEHVPMIWTNSSARHGSIDRSAEVAQRNPGTKRGGGRRRIRVVTR